MEQTNDWKTDKNRDTKTWASIYCTLYIYAIVYVWIWRIWKYMLTNLYRVFYVMWNTWSRCSLFSLAVLAFVFSCFALFVQQKKTTTTYQKDESDLADSFFSPPFPLSFLACSHLRRWIPVRNGRLSWIVAFHSCWVKHKKRPWRQQKKNCGNWSITVWKKSISLSINYAWGLLLQPRSQYDPSGLGNIYNMLFIQELIWDQCGLKKKRRKKDVLCVRPRVHLNDILAVVMQ